MPTSVTWSHIASLVVGAAVIALWAWGAGFWMGTYFVSRADFEAFVLKDRARFAKVVKDAGITPE